VCGTHHGRLAAPRTLGGPLSRKHRCLHLTCRDWPAGAYVAKVRIGAFFRIETNQEGRPRADSAPRDSVSGRTEGNTLHRPNRESPLALLPNRSQRELPTERDSKTARSSLTTVHKDACGDGLSSSTLFLLLASNGAERSFASARPMPVSSSGRRRLAEFGPVRWKRRPGALQADSCLTLRGRAISR
jgi:hypothetical protein